MKFAEVEKERLKRKDYTWLVIGAVTLWYCARLLNAFSAATVYDWERQTRTLNTEGLHVTYISMTLFYGMALLGLYFNSRLFWITERGERSFLMRKYDLAPVTKAEIYRCKARIFVKNMAVYLGLSLAVYLMTMLLYGMKIDVLWTLLGFAGAAAAAGGWIAALFGLAVIQDRRTMRKHQL